MNWFCTLLPAGLKNGLGRFDPQASQTHYLFKFTNYASSFRERYSLN